MIKNDVENGYEEGQYKKIVCPVCHWVSDEGEALSFRVCDEKTSWRVFDVRSDIHKKRRRHL